jgi:Raf kinase inhibitor-like YbhB/YbcL family protein
MYIHSIFTIASIAICQMGLLLFPFNDQLVASGSNELKLNGIGFDDKGQFPKEYTCDSSGISPALSWKGRPKGTESYVLTMHHFDPTGNKHVYWVLYNIPANLQSLPSNASGIGSMGINTVNRRNAYAPPCSKGPGPKQYQITLYAVSKQLLTGNSQGMITMDDVMRDIETSKLDSSLLTVTYSRPSNSVSKSH